MRFNLQRKLLLLLLIVALIALSSAFMLRSLLMRDFKTQNRAKEQEHIYQLVTSLEGRFEQQRGWQRATVTDELIWGLQTGIEARLFAPDGSLLMDTEQALQELPLTTRRRILTATDYERSIRPKGSYQSYVLTLDQQEIGWLETRLLRPLDEEQFLQSANRFLLLSVLILGLLALGMGFFFARRLATPLTRLTTAAQLIADGEFSHRVTIDTADEIGRLAGAFNRMADSLERNERLRRQLLSNAAHELRTPLMVIRGELEGMVDGLLPCTPDALASLGQEVTRLSAILDGIDELTRAEAGLLALRPVQFALRSFLEDIVSRFSGLLVEKDARLELDCAADIQLWGDPDRLCQVILNLLSNAVRAVPQQGLVRLSARTSDSDTVMVEVSDNGCGIAPEHLPHIFERFFKGSSNGLGLGLAITRELVEAHGGSISALNNAGGGATFTLRMPARRQGANA